MTQSNKQKRELLPETKFLILAVSAIVLALIVSLWLIRITYIQGDSMTPTYQEGDWLVSVPIYYTFNEPERGDVILFERSELTAGHIIKRVAALPGETVEIKDGVVYINGEEIEDLHYVHDENNDFGPLTVGEDSYFVLGDNRHDSRDSRFWVEPTVNKNELRGKVVWQFPRSITDLFK